MTKLEAYALEYAQLIAEKNKVNQSIKSLLEIAGDKVAKSVPFSAQSMKPAIDLSYVRESYYENGDHWHGWVFAICHWNDWTEGDEEDYLCPESNEYKLAELLDKKLANRGRLGVVKRSICAIGRGILNNEL